MSLNGQAGGNARKAVDGIQERLASYAAGLTFSELTPQAVHATKVRVIDTLGVLIAGFFAEPCRIARDLAAEMPDPNGATIFGTRMKTYADIAAFVNSTAARYSELTDSYHWPGSYGGHPSDVITPVLGVAEQRQTSGREFITSVVLAYEAYLRMNDCFSNLGFDHTNFCCLGVALGAGKLSGLSKEQFSHCISMAVVPNNALRVSRAGHLTMWKVAATGQAARAGVFAAQLARAGMEGPHLPFEGKSGWCDHVALHRVSLEAMGGNGTPFKIIDTNIKLRPSAGLGISPTLAAEKIAPIRNLQDVREITVEVHKKAKDYIGTGAQLWIPNSRETADHSAPYLVAATLMDGTITPRSYNEAHLQNPELRALIQKIKVIENAEFTKAYARHEQCARVTVTTNNGDQLVGESIGDKDGPSTPKTDTQISDKFRNLTEDHLGARRTNAILERLWHLEDFKNVAEIPPEFVLV